MCLDDELAALEQRVRDHLDGRISDVKFELIGEGLVLRGKTRTYYAKQLAQEIVMQASARPLLANEIEVF
jgi:hypothetical protein